MKSVKTRHAKKCGTVASEAEAAITKVTVAAAAVAAEAAIANSAAAAEAAAVAEVTHRPRRAAA